MSRVFDDNDSNFLKVESLSLATEQDWSIACYVKPDVTTLDQAAVSMGDSAVTSSPRCWLGGNVSTGTARAYTNFSSSTTLASTGTLTATTWQLLVMTYDYSAQTAYIYLDSATPQSAGSRGQATDIMDRIVVGNAADSTPTSAFDGKIAQVAIWQNYLLSNSDVQALLDAGNSTAYAAVQSGSLLCHYPLNNTNLSDSTSTLSDLGVTGTVAASTDDPLPTITSVSSDDIIGAAENPWNITGTGFGSA